jgi:hypothetical protein
LSVNAATLEAGQEGLDLREWHEKVGLLTWMNLMKLKGTDYRSRIGVGCIS